MRELRTPSNRALLERLWIEEPALRDLLETCTSREEAREHVLSYLEDLDSALRNGAFDLDRIEQTTALTWIGALKDMLSPENEALASFSTIDLLWRAARGDVDDMSEDFVEEFAHIFKAIEGQSGLGRGWLHADDENQDFESLPASGRRAARARSHVLDGMADSFWSKVNAHSSGLSEPAIRSRIASQDRILAYLGGTHRDWACADWQAAHVLKGERGARVLQDLVPLASGELAAVRLAVQYKIPWGITPYYLSLFDFDSSDRTLDGQVRSQVIPPLHTVRAMIEHRADRGRAFDFMRERDTSPIDRITRRYPTVAIFKVCDTCPQVCAYCQRNWEIADAMELDHIPSRADLEPALRWFEAHRGVIDVLLTGGDPLLLKDDLLGYLVERFSEMEHIRHVRIGTRIPVVMPMRVTGALAEVLGSAIVPGRRAVSVVTHVESAYEITPDLAAAIDRLRRRGIGVYNQQVFTLETSRRFQITATRIALKQAGIDPYYTFYTKGKDEHRDYLVPIARMLQERKEEARLLPGIFRTDEPVFNVPGLGKTHLRAQQDRELIGIRADGRRVYLFHPWEKGIRPVAPWPYVDVSIYDYLRRIESLGENPEDYESIWYYL